MNTQELAQEMAITYLDKLTEMHKQGYITSKELFNALTNIEHAKHVIGDTAPEIKEMDIQDFRESVFNIFNLYLVQSHVDRV